MHCLASVDFLHFLLGEASRKHFELPCFRCQTPWIIFRSCPTFLRHLSDNCHCCSYCSYACHRFLAVFVGTKSSSLRLKLAMLWSSHRRLYKLNIHWISNWPNCYLLAFSYSHSYLRWPEWITKLPFLYEIIAENVPCWARFTFCVCTLK